jgi:Domain of unknown function (DUF4253)
MAGPAFPHDGELQLGAVRLPSGRRVIPDGRDEPIAWVTRLEVPDPGAVWSALTDLHGETGVVPVILNDEADDYDDLFMEPCDIAEIDGLDAAELLAARWQGELDNDEDDEPAGFPGASRVTEFLGQKQPGGGGNSLFDIVRAVVGAVHDPNAQEELERLTILDRPTHEHREWAARSADREARRAEVPFPGLAPATGGSLSSAARAAALASIRSARIGLIAARRPADVLATVGWTCFDDPAYEDGIRNAAATQAVWIGAILRSWENRFGARLLAIGPSAEIRLLVQRPPRTLELADKIAAEHSAFCDECAGQGLSTVREIAPALVDAPIWTFWWD